MADCYFELCSDVYQEVQVPVISNVAKEMSNNRLITISFS